MYLWESLNIVWNKPYGFCFAPARACMIDIAAETAGTRVHQAQRHRKRMSVLLGWRARGAHERAIQELMGALNGERNARLHCFFVSI